MKRLNKKIDLLQLPASQALEEISKKIHVSEKSNGRGIDLYLGGLAIKSIGSIALKNNESIVLSGSSDNNQGLVVKFGAHDSPTINAKIKVIGIKRTSSEQK